MFRSAAHMRSLAPLVLGALLVVPAAAGPAAAQAPVTAEAAAPRFSFAPVEGGALKLDRETGRVSLCGRGPTGFACEAVPDTRDAYEAEIARLRAELDSLRRADARPVPLPPGTVPPPALTPPGPDTLDLDRALAYAERFYRRLKGMIDELRAPSGQERL